VRSVVAKSRLCVTGILVSALKTAGRKGTAVMGSQRSDEVYYLAGPMTGLENDNHKEFERVQRMLQNRGLNVSSPHTLNNHLTPAERVLEGRLHWMKLSMRMLFACNRLILMPGWELSPGSRTELDVALDLNYPVLLLNEFDELVKLTNKGPEVYVLK
jgi:sugar phosphate isomerase/epimerase